jgi:uncharacterized membrane protein
LPTIDLNFEYNLPKRAVYEWWTDLSGVGYVGKALKSLRVVGKEGEKIVVETQWKIMGMTIKILERFTIHSDEHWIWEPSLFGIDIKDEFRLETKSGEKTILRIHSDISPRGMKGKLSYLMLGWKLDRMMIEEWRAASQALISELANKPKN